jgi:hypothetical protein
MKLEILLALGLCFYQPKIPTLPVIHHDFRVSAIAEFELKHHFIPNDNIKEIIKAADKCDLNPALLVAIDLQESSGGRHYIRSTNNEWGWASDTRSFESETAAIDYISDKLCNGHYYKGKPLTGKIRAYNPSPTYAPAIIKSINEINSYE